MFLKQSPACNWFCHVQVCFINEFFFLNLWYPLLNVTAFGLEIYFFYLKTFEG